MIKILCFIRGVWTSLPQYISGNYPISGHMFMDIEEHDNCKVVVSKCENCGKLDISWSNGVDKYRQVTQDK